MPSITVPRGRISLHRYQMPQIASKDHQEFLELMRLRGISVSELKLPSRSLKAAQNEINMERVQEWITSMPAHAESKPILVSADYYVLDGNHTWLAKLNRDPDSYVDCIVIGLNIEDLLNTSKLFDKVTYKTVNEANMFDIPESLVSKVQNVLNESANKKPPFAKKTEKKKDEDKPKKKDEKDKDDKGLSGKKEKITINPEIRPDILTEPYKVKPSKT